MWCRHCFGAQWNALMMFPIVQASLDVQVARLISFLSQQLLIQSTSQAPSFALYPCSVPCPLFDSVYPFSGPCLLLDSLYPCSVPCPLSSLYPCSVPCPLFDSLYPCSVPCPLFDSLYPFSGPCPVFGSSCPFFVPSPLFLWSLFGLFFVLVLLLVRTLLLTYCTVLSVLVPLLVTFLRRDFLNCCL